MSEPSDPMPDTAAVQVIQNITFTGDTNSKRVAMVMTDTGGDTRAYVITPATVRAFLAPFLSLAAAWSDDPDFSKEGIGGATNALPAQHILFAPGRTDTECAVRVVLAPNMDLVFLLPLETVMKTFGAFAERIRFRTKPN